jgi:fimbrial chaperone protein
MMKFSLHQAACGLALSLTVAGTAWSGSFQVSPLRATLSGSQPVSALTVRNAGTQPAVIQLEAMAWSQPAGEDKYVPAPDILATPPIFTIPAGGSQVIRVGSRRPADASSERAYRLFLREVPPPPKPGFKGLQMALQISLPVFVVPATKIAPDLHWQAVSATNGQIRVGVTNRGTAHVRLAGFTLSPTGSLRKLPVSTQPVYVLPGATHDWLVDARGAVAAGSTLHVSAQADTDTGAVQADVLVSDR